MPVVRDIKVTAVKVPIKPPHRVSGGVVSESPLLLIDVHCADGIVGHAILFTYTPLALKPVGNFVSNLKSVLIGESCSPAVTYDIFHKRFRLLGTQGLVGMALAGIDMALWDAQARRENLPLCTVLGGAGTAVRAYGGTGFDGELDCARQAENWAKQGFTGVKAKIGYESASEDKRVIRAMRQAVGPDVALMIDYNQSLDVDAAIVRLRELDDEGLTWIEEPVASHDFAGSARVTNAVNTPIQSGENWWGPQDMQHALDANASDFVMPDVMKIGGVTGWMKAVALAESSNKPVSSHLWVELSAQLLHIGKTTHWLEYVDWWAPVIRDPLQVIGGFAVIDKNRPGSGLEWNMAAVNTYKV